MVGSTALINHASLGVSRFATNWLSGVTVLPGHISLFRCESGACQRNQCRRLVLGNI